MNLKATSLILIFGYFIIGLAAPERWTIQTVALRDYEEAAAVAESLSTLGYQAYTEFAMNNGSQYTRVRIGCFETRDGAERMATHLRGAITASAVPQHLSPETTLLHCSDSEVGFFKPDSWSIVYAGNTAIVFQVEILDHRGFVEHKNGTWHLRLESKYQELLSSEPIGPFSQKLIEGKPLVFAHLSEGVSAVCPGLLLWHTQDTAIVDDGDAIVSCKITQIP